MLKKLLIAGIISTISYSEVYVTNEMIYESVYEAIKNGTKEVPNLIKFVYNKETSTKKNFWWYFKRNQKMKTILNKNHIDYYTLIKQALYPQKPYESSLENERKKFAVLTTLMYKNNLIPKKETKRKKKKLNIVVSTHKKQVLFTAKWELRCFMFSFLL